MAQTKDFRLRTTTPSTPTAGVVTYFADNSGQLNFVLPNGGTNSVVGFFRKTLTNSQLVVPKTGVFLGAVNTPTTGLVYGTTGVTTRTTILGTPNYWLYSSLSGVNVAIPAYTLG